MHDGIDLHNGLHRHLEDDDDDLIAWREILAQRPAGARPLTLDERAVFHLAQPGTIH